MRMWANQLTASYTLSTRHLSAMRREEHSLRHFFLRLNRVLKALHRGLMRP